MLRQWVNTIALVRLLCGDPIIPSMKAPFDS